MDLGSEVANERLTLSVSGGERSISDRSCPDLNPLAHLCVSKALIAFLLTSSHSDLLLCHPQGCQVCQQAFGVTLYV